MEDRGFHESEFQIRFILIPAILTTKNTKQTKAETVRPTALLSRRVNDGGAANSFFFVSFVLLWIKVFAAYANSWVRRIAAKRLKTHKTEISFAILALFCGHSILIRLRLRCSGCFVVPNALFRFIQFFLAVRRRHGSIVQARWLAR